MVSGRTAEQVADDELASRFDLGWVGQAVTHYNDPSAFQALPAKDGPTEWERRESLTATDGEPIEPVTVSNVTTGDSSVRFDVDRVGEPVLVKVSYFPNWAVSGADGPWRAGPNLMVVVPTDTTVQLSYGWTVVDWMSNLLTLVGVVAVGALAVVGRRGGARPGRLPVVDWSPTDEPDTPVIPTPATGPVEDPEDVEQADGETSGSNEVTPPRPVGPRPPLPQHTPASRS